MMSGMLLLETFTGVVRHDARATFFLYSLCLGKMSNDSGIWLYKTKPNSSSTTRGNLVEANRRCAEGLKTVLEEGQGTSSVNGDE